MRPTAWLLILIVVTTAGCQFSAVRNPNDPNEVSADRQPIVVKAYMKQMSDDVISPAVASRRITDEQGKALMVQGAKDYLKTVHFKNTPPNVVWMVAEAYVTAHEWERAKPLVEAALKFDTDGDRRVNDILWLARCEAELGDVAIAMKTARDSFSAPPEWKWPILYAVIYEIVPAAERMKPRARIELAQLVKDAIKQHEAATGSIEDPVRRDWVALRDFHISRAWRLVVQLYNAANRPDLARAAATEATAKRPHAGTNAIQA